MTALEQQMDQMREEWTVVQQAPLIQARLLNALRETQLEHGRRLDGVENRLDGVENRLGAVESRLGGVEAGVQQIVTMLTLVIGDESPAER